MLRSNSKSLGNPCNRSWRRKGMAAVGRICRKGIGWPVLSLCHWLRVMRVQLFGLRPSVSRSRASGAERLAASNPRTLRQRVLHRPRAENEARGAARLLDRTQPRFRVSFRTRTAKPHRVHRSLPLHWYRSADPRQFTSSDFWPPDLILSLATTTATVLRPLCTAPWSGTPCRTTSAHSRTMSPLDRGLKTWLFSRY